MFSTRVAVLIIQQVSFFSYRRKSSLTRSSSIHVLALTLKIFGIERLRMKSVQFLGSLLFLLNAVLLSHQTYHDTSTTIQYKWKFPEFSYSSEKAKNDAIKKGQWTEQNVCILDADLYPSGNRIFVTTPQFRNGTPATLSEVVKGKNELKPFPSFINSNNQCQGPFSVFRTHIDKCGWLWVPDSGKSDILAAGTATCPAKLLVYDLSNNDKQILNYQFPTGVTTDRSLIVNIVTESYQKDCSDSIAYMSDVMDHGMVVYNHARKSSYRIEHRYFYLYPPTSVITTNGVSFDSYDGLFGLALGPSNDRDRKLYFHSFASTYESWVPVSLLKNQTAANDPTTSRNNFMLSPGQRTGQCTMEVMTEEGILIYPLIPTNEIACWNSKTPFTAQNQHVLHRDNENFQFISGMKLVGNKLVMLSSRFQNFNVGILNGTDYKYRVIVIEDVKRLLQNTRCTSSSAESPEGSDSSSNGAGSCNDYSCQRPQGTKPSGTSSGVHRPTHSRPHGPFIASRIGESEGSAPTEMVEGADIAPNPNVLGDSNTPNNTHAATTRKE